MGLKNGIYALSFINFSKIVFRRGYNFNKFVNVTPIVGVCNCSMFCCMLLYVNSSIAIILMGERELVALLNLSSWRLVMVEWLFLAVSWACLRFVIFPDQTHYFLWFCKKKVFDTLKYLLDNIGSKVILLSLFNCLLLL